MTLCQPPVPENRGVSQSGTLPSPVDQILANGQADCPGRDEAGMARRNHRIVLAHAFGQPQDQEEDRHKTRIPHRIHKKTVDKGG
jgi:hypothetical protein